MENKQNGFTCYSAEHLRKISQKLVTAMGVPADDAKNFIDCLITSDMRGVHTHGLRCLTHYIDKLTDGTFNKTPNIKIVKETPVSALIDGDSGIGYVISHKAMNMAIEKAKKTGVGLVSVYNSNHNGAVGYFARMAQKENLIGFSSTNGSARMPAPGGLTPVIGNNPWSYAFPYAEGGVSIALDMSNTAVSAGKVFETAESGKNIPMTWILDKDGKPTNDVEKFVFMQGIGGHKGYCLSVVMEVLTSILSGYGAMAPFSKPGSFTDTAHFFMAFDPSMFVDLDVFKSRMTNMVDGVKTSELMDGVDEVFLPGEIDQRNYDEALKNGVLISDVDIKILDAECKKYGVESY